MVKSQRFNFVYTQSFLKAHKSLPQAVQDKVARQLSLLADNPSHPSLHAERFVSIAGVWKARIDFHYRITYMVDGQTITLRNVGIRNKVYRRP